jgi:hypothetical protein
MTDQGIISGFQERRQLEDAVSALGQTTTEVELVNAARQLVNRFPAERLAAAIQRRLGDPNSQLRGGLGHMSALLPPEVIVPVLREVTGNRQKPPIERMTALLILERYLGETVPAALTGDLVGNDDIAMQSLLEAVEEGRRNRHVFLEYVTQMQEHGIDVAFMVMGLMNQLAPDDQVELLRLIAQDARPQVARSALERLVALAAAHDQALTALHTLVFTLAPSLVESAQRSLRKLQFTGRRYTPPPTDAWRALLGPTDAGGYFTLWLVKMPTYTTTVDGVLIGFTLGLEQGIIECSGVASMEASQLPPVRRAGDLVVIGEGAEPRIIMLETPLDVGRWLVQQALAAHWRQPEPADLPGEYKLYNDLIWQFAPPHLPDNCSHIFAEMTDTGLEQPDLHSLHDAADVLMQHPLMRAWIGWAANIWTMLDSRQGIVSDTQMQAMIAFILREIDALPQRARLLDNMATGLRTQALWFAIHDEVDNAGRALRLARGMHALPLRQNPLLTGLLQAGYAQYSPR